MTKWKECPFCGKYGYNLRIKVLQSADGEVWAECQECHAKGPIIYSTPGMPDESLVNLAQAAWNARRKQDKLIQNYMRYERYGWKNEEEKKCYEE